MKLLKWPAVLSVITLSVLVAYYVAEYLEWHWGRVEIGGSRDRR